MIEKLRMRVGQLIDELKKFPLESHVYIYGEVESAVIDLSIYADVDCVKEDWNKNV